MEEREEGRVPEELLREDMEGESILFISPFKAVQSDMTPAFWSAALGLRHPQGATKARSLSWRKGQRNKVPIQRERGK